MIEKNDFTDALKLTSIVISDTVESIESDTFSFCPIVYAKVPTIVLRSMNKSFLREIEITSGNDLYSACFSNCDNLVSVNLSENCNIDSIKEYTFSFCDSLTNVYIPSSVARIEKYAFNECSSLSTISFCKNSKLCFK